MIFRNGFIQYVQNDMKTFSWKWCLSPAEHTSSVQNCISDPSG